MLQSESIQISAITKPGLKSHWLSYLIAVGQNQNLLKASQNQGVTPQTLKRNLDELADYLSIKLLHLQGSDVIFSPQGLALLTDIRKIHQQFIDLTRPYTDQSLNIRLRIASTHSHLQSQLLQLSQVLRRNLPEQSLSFQINQQQSELEQALLSEQLDLCLSLKTPTNPAIEYTCLPSSPYHIASAPHEQKAWHEWMYALTYDQKRLKNWQSGLDQHKILMQSTRPESLMMLARKGHCAVYLPECLLDIAFARSELAPVSDPPEEFHLTPHLLWSKKFRQSDLSKVLPYLKDHKWDSSKV